ncbi:MAG: DUF1579 family protein [Chthoniobacterales bacterium]
MNFEALKIALMGEWTGTSQLYLEPPPAKSLTSSSQLSVTSIAGGSFLQFAYDWAYEGKTQTGLLLLGADGDDVASAAWVDSFHMSSKIMSCAGAATPSAADLRGNYAAPSGPDWGWRITVRSVSRAELQIVMHNLSPEGQEDLAVQADYQRQT